MGTAGRDCEPSGLQRAVWHKGDLFCPARGARSASGHSCGKDVRRLWRFGTPSGSAKVPGLDQRRENAHMYDGEMPMMGARVEDL